MSRSDTRQLPVMAVAVSQKHICDLGVLSAGVNCVPHDLLLLFVHVDHVNIFCGVGKKINNK